MLGPDSASGIRDVSFVIFLAFSATFFLSSAVAEGFAAFVLLHCCKLLPSDKPDELLVINLLSGMKLVVWSLLFGREASPRSTRSEITISCT